MKKRRKISIAWFMFFAAMSYLLVNQWGRIASVLAGLALALWLTSRIKIRFLYATWLIFPLLCLLFLNQAGNRVVEWTDQNSPRFVTSRIVDETKDVFQKLVSIPKKISEKNHRNNGPLTKR